MYQQHFGLQELPFSLTPDTGYFFPYGHYSEAMNTLLVALRSGEGFIKVVGEVGTGNGGSGPLELHPLILWHWQF